MAGPAPGTAPFLATVPISFPSLLGSSQKQILTWRCVWPCIWEVVQEVLGAERETEAGEDASAGPTVLVHLTCKTHLRGDPPKGEELGA
jgi:hypothetical protein